MKYQSMSIRNYAVSEYELDEELNAKKILHKFDGDLISVSPKNFKTLQNIVQEINNRNMRCRRLS